MKVKVVGSFRLNLKILIKFTIVYVSKQTFFVRNYFVLPSLTEEGYRVTIFRLCDTDIEKFSLQAIVRRILMVLDIRLMEEFCLSNIMVIDLEV